MLLIGTFVWSNMVGDTSVLTLFLQIHLLCIITSSLYVVESSVSSLLPVKYGSQNMVKDIYIW